MTAGPEHAPPSVVLDAAGLRRHVALPGGDRLQILDGVDLTVRRGEFTAIVGRSGSGKTTLLATLGMLTAVQTGSLTILGTDVTTMRDARRARLRNTSIGYVFQSYSLVRHLSAYRNVELPLLYGRRMRRRDRRRRVHAALDLVGLGNRRRSRPRHLSGGEQQRVAIARALVREPILMLADEPTGALDVETGRQVLDVLVAATRARGCALVVVTHDETLARRADRTLVMESGLLRSARP